MNEVPRYYYGDDYKHLEPYFLENKPKKEHYQALGVTTSTCIGCKSCEDRCPFQVEIADRMQKTAELFGC